MKRLFIPVVLLANTSCATIFSGSKARVTIDANVDKAKYVMVDGRKHTNVSFPLETKVKRGFNESVVTAEAEGQDKATIYVDKNFNAVAVLNLFGILGWGIDAATGAMMKPEYKYYELEFEPKE